ALESRGAGNPARPAQQTRRRPAAVADCGNRDACAIAGQQPILAKTDQPNGLVQHSLNPHSYQARTVQTAPTAHSRGPIRTAALPGLKNSRTFGTVISQEPSAGVPVKALTLVRLDISLG